MKIEEINTPEDIYDFMEENIAYGWLDCYQKRHVMELKDFRKLYRTMSLEECLENKIGVCIEQVMLMHYLLDRIKIQNKMFCCRIYEPDDYGNLEEEEHMHCFVLYYSDGLVFHLEHPNFKEKGIHIYQSEEEAISSIVAYYVNMRGGKESPTTEFFEIKPHLSFKEFNAYINSLSK